MQYKVKESNLCRSSANTLISQGVAVCLLSDLLPFPLMHDCFRMPYYDFNIETPGLNFRLEDGWEIDDQADGGGRWRATSQYSYLGLFLFFIF